MNEIKGKIMGVVALFAIIGAGSWYVFSKGLISFTDTKAADVVRSMESVRSFKYNGSVQVSLNQPSSFKMDFNGSIDSRDLNNVNYAFSSDISLDSWELSGEKIKLSFDVLSADGSYYILLRNLKGLGPNLPEGISNQWISISEEDIYNLYGLSGLSGSETQINNAEIEKITEKYASQFRGMAKKYNLINILSAKNSGRVEGEYVRTTKFNLNEEETIAFAKEALPVYAAFVSDMMREFLQYDQFSYEDDFRIYDSDYEELERGLRSFFENSSAVFTATTGKASSLLYDLAFDIDVRDDPSGESAKIIGDISMRNFGKPFKIEVPKDAIPIEEIIQNLQSPSYDTSAKTRDALRAGDVYRISTVAEIYFDTYGKYPKTFGDFGPYFSNPIPTDPLTYEQYGYAVNKSGTKYQVWAQFEYDPEYIDALNADNDINDPTMLGDPVDGAQEICAGGYRDCIFDIGIR